MCRIFFINIIFLLASTTPLLLYAVTHTASKNIEQSPGIIESLQLFVDIQKNKFHSINSQAHNNKISSKKIRTLKNIRINPHFMQGLLFSTNDKYLNLLKGPNNIKCKFYALLENDLVKGPLGKIINIVIDYEKEGNTYSGTVEKQALIKYVYEQSCFDYKKIRTKFSENNYIRTLRKLKYLLPKSKAECKKITDEWSRNIYLPYICHFPELLKTSRLLQDKVRSKKLSISSLVSWQADTVRISKNYKNKISLFSQTYIKNLCNHISDQAKFCSIYLTDNLWDEIIRGERKKYLMTYRCKLLLKKDSLKLKDLKKCSRILQEKPQVCTTLGIKKYPSLFPKPDCNSIADALYNSRLKNDYQDCPARIDYENIVNINRILQHYYPKKLISNTSTCVNESMNDFAKIIIELDDDIDWPLKLCFKNLTTRKTECKNYVPGNNPKSDISESKVAAWILGKTRGAPPDEVCTIIGRSTYNPIMLKYKSGCYIVVDMSRCTGFDCKRNIYYRGEEIKNIEYQGRLNFEYFPILYLKEKFAINSVFKKKYKLRDKKISNITILKDFLTKNPNAIIHGVGCAEELLPHFFRMNSLNHCHPTPFIIDGFDINLENLKLSIRTSMDDIHSPRLLDWNHVFSAITVFQKLHPMNTWTLYGHKK